MLTRTFDELLQDQKYLVILRGLPASETVKLANLAWDIGIDALEVPIGERHQTEALAAAVRAGANRGKVVGAGTVVTEGHVDRAARAGAAYTVAPGFDPDVLAASHAADLPHLPGVATASEVQMAVALGCAWVKVFPASQLGPKWFSAMSGPFPHVKTVATGGIAVSEARSYLEAGVNVVGLGSALADEAQLELLKDLLQV